MNLYILDGTEVVPCPDMEVWTKWMATADRMVALNDIAGMTVSTVFLGAGHGHRGGIGRELVFETMIFDGKNDDYQTRSSTWNEALVQHSDAICHVLNLGLELPIMELVE